MTSICSSPPISFYRATLATSPTLASRNSFQQVQNGIATPGGKVPLSQGIPISLPRGHDSSDVEAAYLNATPEENVSKTSHNAEDQGPVQAVAMQPSSKDPICLLEDGDPQGPFEGPEKLLELWFADSKDEVAGEGLRTVERYIWEDMLDIVKCKVLSTVKGSDVDAYLLR
jgi:hypothetical protein